MEVEASSEVAWDVNPAGDDAVGPPPGLAVPPAAAAAAAAMSADARALRSSFVRTTDASNKASAQRTRTHDLKQKKQQQKAARGMPHAATAQRTAQAAPAASSRPDVYQLKGVSSTRDANAASASDDDI